MVPGALHLGEVTNAPQQGIGDTWRTPTAPGDLVAAFFGDRHAHDLTRAINDVDQRLDVVVVEQAVDAEAGAHGGGEQSHTGGQRRRA